MSNTTDVDDIRAEGLQRVGEPGSSSSDFWTLALVYLVEIFHTMRFHRPWKFTLADPPGSFVTVAPVTSLTVNVTQDSTSATLSSSVTADLAGRKIEIGNNVYRIATHGGSTDAIVLDVAYIETSDADAACTIFQDEYDLSASDFGRLIRLRDLRGGTIVARRDIEHSHIRSQLANPTEGVPSQFALLTDTRLIFDRYPQDARRYEYDYQVQATDPAAAGSIDIPRRWRPVVRDGLAYKLSIDKDDDRAQAYKTDFLEGLERMEREEFWDADFAQVEPPLVF